LSLDAADRRAPSRRSSTLPYHVGVSMPDLDEPRMTAVKAVWNAPRAGLFGGVLLVLALAAAVSTDVVRAGYGVKSDEATYAAMTLSLAHDGNLSYERRDLERFWSIYSQGPEGIFLKKGKRFRIRVTARPPFLAIDNDQPEPRDDRFFYAKAFVYPLAAAPFVWLFGMSGFLVFHVLLLAAACWCGYRFLAARSSPAAAFTFTAAFVGASIVPVYLVFLMPEMFNFSLVFLAYFVWLYKEVAEPRSWLLRGWTSDLLAAALVGIVTYSKPTNVLLIVPLVALAWWRRQFWRGFATGTAFAVVTASFFVATALVSGEFNYQGGDRATFYGSYPFDGREPKAWDRRFVTTTDSPDTANVMALSELPNRLGQNIKYFLVGRHFGFVPYFFPGFVALLAWAVSGERLTAWRLLILASFVGSALILLLWLPYTWSGGGGPPGNRYFLSAYPAIFFVMPPFARVAPAIIALVGGALFTAKVLVNPFVAAKFTWQITESGPARYLPVELTMANDLPVRLDTRIRARIPYGRDPEVYLYFLDQNAYPPEPTGMWVGATGRADIIVRTDHPIHHLAVKAESPIRTTLTVSMGRVPVTITLEPGRPATFDVPADGVRGLESYAYLMTARATRGFVPRLVEPGSDDNRHLGALLRFRAITSR
jgi:hypothetical protein